MSCKKNHLGRDILSIDGKGKCLFQLLFLECALRFLPKKLLIL